MRTDQKGMIGKMNSTTDESVALFFFQIVVLFFIEHIDMGGGVAYIMSFCLRTLY